MVKTWDDDNNRDGKRPENITVRLYADGKEIKEAQLTDTYTFKDLPKYRDHGKEIVYTITEDAVADYTTSYDGFNITNKHTPGMTNVNVMKVWEDNDNQDGIRPANVTVELLADGEVLKEAVMTDKYIFTDLPAKKDGKDVVYTVREKAVEGYTSSVSGDAVKGFVITNAHTPATTKLTVTKTWKNDTASMRPDSITIRIYADGDEVKSFTMNSKTDTSKTFTAPKYKNGKEIVYTVLEDAVDGYMASYDGLNITNTKTDDLMSISVVKKWNDKDDKYDARPSSITVQLYKNGSKLKEMVIKRQDGWTGTFDNLPIEENGKKIEYTLKEKSVNKYSGKITGNAKDGFTVTNTYKTSSGSAGSSGSSSSGSKSSAGPGTTQQTQNNTGNTATSEPSRTGTGTSQPNGQDAVRDSVDGSVHGASRGIPKTGENNALLYVFLLMLASGAAMVVMGKTKKKKED